MYTYNFNVEVGSSSTSCFKIRKMEFPGNFIQMSFIINAHSEKGLFLSVEVAFESKNVWVKYKA